MSRGAKTKFNLCQSPWWRLYFQPIHWMTNWLTEGLADCLSSEVTGWWYKNTTRPKFNLQWEEAPVWQSAVRQGSHQVILSACLCVCVKTCVCVCAYMSPQPDWILLHSGTPGQSPMAPTGMPPTHTHTHTSGPHIREFGTNRGLKLNFKEDLMCICACCGWVLIHNRSP